MSTTSKPREKAMYVAPQSDKDWLLNEQKKLYERSRKEPGYAFCKLWGLVTDPRNLRIALARVAQNKGRRTSGVDGKTVRMVLADGVESFVAQLRAELRSGGYRPSPVRRVLIPKRGQPGKTRPLGIPTVRDRVVQAAVKNIMEPIFEADFCPFSFGFRSGKSVHSALETLQRLLRPRTLDPRLNPRDSAYQYAIEGDIKGCFDNIDHHGLMERVRRRVGDAKLNRLLGAFLKSGILSEMQFLRTESGTPQGGILSPLLANIALSAVEERYERHTWPHVTPPITDLEARRRRAASNRGMDRAAGRVVKCVVRYADDFIVLVSVAPGPNQMERARELALQEKMELAAHLREQLGLELSETKTLVTPVTKGMRFLGHLVGVKPHTNGILRSVIGIPRDCSQRLREDIKDLFRNRLTGKSLEDRLQILNAMIRGWAYFYRHAYRASRVFSRLDYYAWWTIYRWLLKKHQGLGVRAVAAKYLLRRPGRRTFQWRDGDTTLFLTRTIRTGPFLMAWETRPDFAKHTYGEPGA